MLSVQRLLLMRMRMKLSLINRISLRILLVDCSMIVDILRLNLTVIDWMLMLRMKIINWLFLRMMVIDWLLLRMLIIDWLLLSMIIIAKLLLFLRLLIITLLLWNILLSLQHPGPDGAVFVVDGGLNQLTQVVPEAHDLVRRGLCVGAALLCHLPLLGHDTLQVS